MTTTMTPYRSELPAGRDGFPRLLRAEWTKFRTVRGWVLTLVLALLVIVGLGLVTAVGSHSSCSNGPVEVACPTVPTGPGGEAVTDRFSFVHRPLAGDGSITVRVTEMTGVVTYPPPNHDKLEPRVQQWAKAGIMVKKDTSQGSAYAAMMATGGHGVRMQDNFVHDTAGSSGRVSATSPRWLRLVRSGDTLTGYESSDGTAWTRVDTARLDGLPETVQVGLFVTSPGDLTVARGEVGGVSAEVRFTQATGVFDHVSVDGGRPGTAWSRTEVGAGDGHTDWERFHRANGLVASGGTFRISGTGDVAPSVDGPQIERSLTGVLVGLVVVIIVAVLFLTAEYRRGLIRTTLLASPRRGRVLAAKAVVIGAVTFVAGLAGAAIALPWCLHILRANGNQILPVSTLTEVRVVVGTAAVLAAAAVFALALGALVRRGAAAAILAIGVIVLPQLLATASVLPTGLSEWLLRLTPAAGFAIQQSIPAYPQVDAFYVPASGFFPLPPLAGLAVLCAYAALALGLAIVLIRRRDA